MGWPMCGFLASRTSKKVGGHIKTVLLIRSRTYKDDDSGWGVGISRFRSGFQDAELSAILNGFVTVGWGRSFRGGTTRGFATACAVSLIPLPGIPDALERVNCSGMLNRCANPGCARRFRKLEDGKLFLVEGDIPEAAAGAGRFGRHLEHYWLCDQCASVLTLS